MSFRENKIQEFNLFDPVYTLSDNLQKQLNKSWVAHFYKEIFLLSMNRPMLSFLRIRPKSSQCSYKFYHEITHLKGSEQIK